VRFDRFIFFSILILGIFYTFHLASDLLLPIFIALLLAAIFSPVIRLLNRVKVPDVAAAIIIVALFVTSVSVASYYLSDPAKKWLIRMPGIFYQVDYELRSFLKTVKKVHKTAKQLEGMTELDDDRQPNRKVEIEGTGLADQFFVGVRSFFWSAAIVVALLFFFLAHGRATVERLLESLPQTESKQKWTELLPEIQWGITRYLGTITVINTLLGGLIAVAMSFFDFPNPIFWGVVAGLFNFVPYLGAATTLVLLTIVSVLSFDTAIRMLLPPLTFLFLTAIEGNFVTPLVVGKSLRLNPIMVFLSVLFWGTVWGGPGVLLAVPILASLKIITEKVEALRPINVLLS